jgi:tetratricopeptide (TPR) repeat protein
MLIVAVFWGLVILVYLTWLLFALKTCREKSTCDYLLLLDADMVLSVSPEFNWNLVEKYDVYNLIQKSSIEYENVRVIPRNADDIQYIGSTHEYCNIPNHYTRHLVPKHLICIIDVEDGKCKHDKFERDEKLLRKEFSENPTNPRVVFYLANTLKDLGKYSEAIPFYEKRATMENGWFAERDYSSYMLSACYLGIHDIDNARKYAEIAAFQGHVKRAEPLYFLALYLHRQKDYELAWYYATLAALIPKPDDVSKALFIQEEIYDKWVDFELDALARQIFNTQEPRFCMKKFVKLCSW